MVIHGDGPFVSVPLLHTVTHSSGTAQLGSQLGSQLGDGPFVTVPLYLQTSAIHAAETGHSRPLFCPAEVEIIYRTIRTKLK